MSANTEMRTHCIAVRHGPPEIREIMVRASEVNLWETSMHHKGWTTCVQETRRVPVRES